MIDRGVWKQQDRPHTPCPYCKTELYEQFWGNSGWILAEKATDYVHGNCVSLVAAERDRLFAASLALSAAFDLPREVMPADVATLIDQRDVAERASEQAKTLLIDVDDMMGALRLVASMEYDRAEVRTIAHLALDRLKKRGIGG